MNIVNIKYQVREVQGAEFKGMGRGKPEHKPYCIKCYRTLRSIPHPQTIMPEEFVSKKNKAIREG